MSNNPKHKNVEIKCFAKTRKHGLCQTPPVTGKKRCRMHGGSKGIGAPKGSKNAFKHGRYSKETITARREVTAIIRQWKALFNDMS